MLNNNQPQNNIQMLLDLYKKGGNPQNALMSIIMSGNPQMQPIIQSMQQGMNPKDIFYNLCQERGIDPNTIINQLKK